MRIRISLIVIFSLLSYSILLAQIKPNAHVFKIKVTDKNTKAHIPYALVNIKDSKNKFMTNSNGDCEIEIPYAFWRAKKISFEIASSGYINEQITIKTKKKKKDDVYVIKLKATNHKSAKL